MEGSEQPTVVPRQRYVSYLHHGLSHIIIGGLDGLQPGGGGSLLYVLYEVLSGTVVGAIQLENANAEQLTEWRQAYQKYPVLATLSDGEDTLIATLKQTWSNVPHQRCQKVFDKALSLNIDLLFLPPYSPNLNLIERLWKFVKKEVLYNENYKDFNAFCKAISGCLNETDTTHK